MIFYYFKFLPIFCHICANFGLQNLFFLVCHLGIQLFVPFLPKFWLKKYNLFYFCHNVGYFFFFSFFLYNFLPFLPQFRLFFWFIFRPILSLNFNFRPDSLKFHILPIFFCFFWFFFSFFFAYFWPIFGSKTFFCRKISILSYFFLIFSPSKTLLFRSFCCFLNFLPFSLQCQPFQ